MNELHTLGMQAKEAARILAAAPTEQKNRALEAISAALLQHADQILSANRADFDAAKASGMSDAMLDRLTLTEARLKSIADAVLKVRDLPDPVGETIERYTLENGLDITKVRVPLGVVGIIYESRPNVTVDAAVLCLKSGNAAFLRGGSETIRSNIALESVMRRALADAGLPESAVTLLHDTSRETASEMMQLRGLIDVLIPRGGAGLHKLCREQSTIPVITGGIGVCHIFVDETAEIAPALKIIVNAKTQRPSTCNTVETLLVHRNIADTFLPALSKQMAESGVTLHAAPSALPALQNGPAKVEPVKAEQYDDEYLSLDLNVKVVADMDEAIAHIREHGTQHSDAILTRTLRNANRFINEVDSSAVYVNASTRFTDGGQFGLGAEVAVSTQKLHARGPMGLEALTTYKWIGFGDDTIRA